MQKIIFFVILYNDFSIDLCNLMVYNEDVPRGNTQRCFLYPVVLGNRAVGKLVSEDTVESRIVQRVKKGRKKVCIRNYLKFWQKVPVL